MGSAGGHQVIIDKLYNLYKQNGYLREEEALDLMIAENTSLVGINRITDKLIEMGVIFDEGSSSDADDEYDRAQVSYDSIYEEILSISPGQEIFVNYLREIRPPQHREWQQLVMQMSSGNDYAYNRLFEMYLRVAARIALRYAKDENIELDDAIQEGAMGLMRAIKQFDPSQHGNLGSYLPLWIQQYISRAIADKGRIIRLPVHMHETVEKIQKSKEKLIALYGAEPSFELLSIETDIPTGQLEQIVSIIKDTSDLLSIEELVNDIREDSILNRDENSYLIDDDVTYSFLCRDLAEVMQTLKPREEKVLSMRFGLLDGLADNFDDVLESVLKSVEETICNDESAAKLNRIDKSLSALESKRKKLTDMLLDDKITKDAYDEKYDDITRKIKQEKEERSLYASNVNAQKDVGQRMRDIRILLNEAEGIKKFDRVVFESIVEKVIVGETNVDGSPDPYKLTFVLRGIDDRAVPDAKNQYLNLRKKKNKQQ